MRITDRLRVEHGVFLVQLRFLEQLLATNTPPRVLGWVVATIAAAEEHHSQLEERVLFPALSEVMGPAFGPLQAVRADHLRIQALTARIQAAEGGVGLVQAYVDTMRRHLEEEIHGLFPLIEEILSPSTLETLSNWNAEHVFVEMGKELFAEGG